MSNAWWRCSTGETKGTGKLAILVDPAIGQLEKLLDSKVDSVKLAAVKDILDRAGYKRVDRVEQTTFEGEDVESLECLTDEELDELYPN